MILISTCNILKNEGAAVVKALIDATKTSASSANRLYSSVRSFLRQSNKKDKDTALHLAVRRNHLDLVKHILEVDPSLLIKNKKSDFKSTIYKAAEQGYTDMVSLLCHPYEAQNNLVHKGQIALCAAIVGRDTESVKSNLQKANHPVTYVDDRGWTPLHYAACYKFDSVLKILVEAQASVECEVVYKFEKKIPTPLCVAAKEGHISTVIMLMELLPGSCIVANNEGQNILHLAAVQNNKKMIQFILRYCPHKYTEKNLKKKDVSGNTPLHLLISQGCFIPELMDNKKWPVDMMTRNNKNWTPADMLYFEEEIVGDQALIRNQLQNILEVDMQAIPRPRMAQRKHKFWEIMCTSRSSMPLMFMEKSSRQSLVPLSKRSRKDAKFRTAKKEMMMTYGKRSRQMENTQIVISALITTITFTVGFTIPGGLHQSGETDQGLALISKKTAFKVFMESDTLALLLSSHSLFLYFFQSYGEDPLSSLMQTSKTKALNMVSVVAMLITFVSGIYVVLSHSPALANAVAIISAYLFLLIIFSVIASSLVLNHKKEEV